METEFIYWRHPSVPGIKVEEVCGGEDKKGRVWIEMAKQVYCENGKDGYRELGHYHNGAPFLYGDESRISVSHTEGMLVVATLPSTPEVDLSEFSLRAAMGVDVERADREQVLRIREKYLSPQEQSMIPADDVPANVMAWTAKEACYKAMMGSVPDFAGEIRIEKMPVLGPATPVYDKEMYPEIIFGMARMNAGEEEIELTLYSYESEGFIITLAYSPKCAKFGKYNP